MNIRITRLIATILWAQTVVAQTNDLQKQSAVNSWTYFQIDDQNSKWGDFDEPKWLRYFGLDMGDLNGDGMLDILTGRTVYLNPGGEMDGSWQKVDLGINVDGILIMDVDGDKFGDVIAQALPDVFWLESTNQTGSAWEARKVGEVPATTHVNSQGFTQAQIVAGRISGIPYRGKWQHI